MGFAAGRVTFCRFNVVGDAPVSVDDTAIGTLSDHAFKETDAAGPDDVETGFVGNAHLFDTQFSYDANAFGNPPGSLLLCGVRIDSHQVPAEVRHAYRKMEEQAVAALNPSGFASKAQKRDAQDVAERHIHEELRSGKYRKSKLTPILWNLATRQLFVGATAASAVEHVASLLYRAFNVQLEPLSAGGAAQHVFGANQRDFEDLLPARFTNPPADAKADHEDAEGPADINIPRVPWIKSGHNTRDFLGNEMLIWLWWTTETSDSVIRVPEFVAGKSTGRHSDIAVMFDRSLDMDCAWDVRGKQSLRGDKPTRLPEAAEALATGKWPRKAGLILADNDDETQWELTLQGDRMQVSGLALPKIEEAETMRDIIDARLDLTVRLADVLDGLFRVYLDERRSSGWSGKRDAIREWIAARRKKRK